MMSKWKAMVLVVVAGLHIIVGYSLYAYRPDALVPRANTRPSAQLEQLIMLLEFPEPERAPRARQKPARTRTSQSVTAASLSPDAAPAHAISEPPVEATHALDLRMPPPVDVKFSTPELLEHRRAISYQGTRYERAWISNGNLTHVVARRSRVASLLLGAMGALVESCTEEDRSHYKQRCVPDQYVHEPEELSD